MPCIVMACIVMARTVMACTVMAYTVMAYTLMARYVGHGRDNFREWLQIRDGATDPQRIKWPPTAEPYRAGKPLCSNTF